MAWALFMRLDPAQYRLSRRCGGPERASAATATALPGGHEGAPHRWGPQRGDDGVSAQGAPEVHPLLQPGQPAGGAVWRQLQGAGLHLERLLPCGAPASVPSGTWSVHPASGCYGGVHGLTAVDVVGLVAPRIDLGCGLTGRWRCPSTLGTPLSRRGR